MKSSIIILLISLASLVTNAATEYIACKDANTQEYNLVLELQNLQVVAYGTQADNFEQMIPVQTNSEDWLFVTYVEEYDTNYSYKIFLRNNLLDQVNLIAMTSGNDSDNYSPVETPADVICHQLKNQPVNTRVSPENYLRTIPTLVSGRGQ